MTDALSHRLFLSELETRVLTVASQLQADPQYTTEEAIKELLEIADELVNYRL